MMRTTFLASRRARTVLAATLLSAAVVTVATLTAVPAISAGRAPAVVAAVEPATQGTKPTVVFVHGGWADSSGFNAEVAALVEKGYPVVSAANPLRGLPTDSSYVSSVLSTIPGPVVLVGHSYGGMVLSNAATGHDNVKALVYIAAFAPDKGESTGQLVGMNPGTLIGDATLDFRPYTQGGLTGTDTYIKKDSFRAAFAGDLPESVTRLMAATQRPFAAEAFDQVSGVPAWKTIPSWYLIATDDKAIPPATQEFMAKRANAHITRTKASHVPMISKPRVTTEVIFDAIHAVG